MVNALIDALPSMDSKRDIRNKRWLSNWSKIRKRGFLRFWMIYGLLYLILSFAVLFLLTRVFHNQILIISEFQTLDILQMLLISIALGLVIAALRWLLKEIRFRRLSAKYPQAIRLF